MSSHMNKCSDTLCINLEKMAESGLIFDFREWVFEILSSQWFLNFNVNF